MCGLI